MDVQSTGTLVHVLMHTYAYIGLGFFISPSSVTKLASVLSMLYMHTRHVHDCTVCAIHTCTCISTLCAEAYMYM